MKTTFVFVAITLLTVIGFLKATTSNPYYRTKHLLGAKQCTWGPSYWCQNITNAANCNAVKHCIQTVWEHKKLPPDDSSVCQTCLDMVKQARDQLLSNQTEEEIKEVFDGSCNLIPVQIIAKECRNVVDQFVPELVDTLASQMNPQVVCSVAGLCNNERYQKMLNELELQSTARSFPKIDRCKGCLTVLRLTEQRFDSLSRDHVLQEMLKVCGRMGSLSDSCSNIILTYFTEIYNHLQENLGSNEFCIMAGECNAQFHRHTTVTVTPLSNVGIVDVSEKDDLPCDLCEQLVFHLRDVLIANTTEDEFERVLLGICKQTKSFAKECTDIVEQYYPEIYRFLSDEINGTVLCSMIGICPRPGYHGEEDNVPIVPLLPVQTVNKYHSERRVSVPVTRGGSSVRVINNPQMAQLPIERVMPQTLTMIGNTQLCTFCEYFLHYVQQAITDPKTEDEIKEAVDKACNHLPSSVNATCREFVDTYGDAFVALLAQEIDPSVICPLLSVCKADDSHDVDVFMKDKGDKPNCPLCLFAVTKLEEELKTNKSEAEIRKELNTLCSHLSKKLKEECDDFVDTYADRIVESILADLTPQEVCVYLRLCSESSTSSSTREPHMDIVYGGEILTNEIPDHTANGKTLITATVSNRPVKSPECVICEFVMTQLEKVLKNNKTDAEIMNAVKTICTILPKTVNEECTNFVNKYGELIIKLLQDEVAPKLICGMIELCVSQDTLRNEIQECAVCQAATMTMAQILENPKINHDNEHVFDKTCRALPANYQKKCRDILRVYGYDLFVKLQSSPVGDNNACDELGLCQGRPKRQTLVGRSKCTWGPSYWCSDENNARECGQGAVMHCQEKVWRAEHP